MSFIYRLSAQNYNFPGILADDVRVALVRLGGGPGEYTPAQNTDEFLDIVPGLAIAAASPLLLGKTFTLGVFHCADWSFGVVAAGAPCQGLVIYQDTGVAATSRLLALIDVGAGLPVTPDGIGLIEVAVNPSGLFQLVA